MTNDMTNKQPAPGSEETRLDSWKAIAAHLKRDVRTVRRWEKSEGLPVHRHLHQSQSTVYAYASEINVWSATRRPRREEAPAWRRPVPALAFAAVLMLSLLLVADAPYSTYAAAAQQAPGSSAMTTRRVWSPEPGEVSGMGSTDGRYLSYGDSTGNLVVRDLATGETHRLTNKGPYDPSTAAETDYSVISPDGRQVAYAFWNGHYDLRVVPVSAASSGAPPRILLSNEDVDFAEPEDWSPDGTQVLAALARKDKTNQLALISAADGSLRVLKSLDWRWPDGRFSPDGRYVAYDVQIKQDSPDREIFVLATDGSREIALVQSPGTGRVLGWAPDGKRILFASNRTGSTGAWSIGVAEGRPQGAPELVNKGDIGGVTPMGSTRNGALYYRLPTELRDVYVASLDMAAGKVTVPPAPINPRLLGGKQNAAWSPDGQFLAYLSGGGLHIRSMRTDEEREPSLSPNVTFDNPTRFGRFHWSPDGRSLLARAADEKQHQGIYRIDVQTGAVASIVREEQGQGAPAYGVWSADGKAIFYALNRSNFFATTGSRLAKEAEDKLGIRVRDLETGRDTEVYRPALLSQINHLALSPNGRWLAFVSNRTVEIAGQPAKVEEDLMVMPAAGGDARKLLEVHEGVNQENALAVLEWTRDGEHLLYSWNRQLWKISANGGPAQKLGLASTTARQASLSVHPDGQRIAFTSGEPKQEVWVMENFWPALNGTK